MSNVLVLDSVTHLLPEHAGHVAYCASHGGTYAAYLAATFGIGALILNDAGIGRERAGIAGLALLQQFGVAAAAIGHQSARIGDGADGFARGTLSFCNATATRLGLQVGMSCATALHHLAESPHTPSPRPAAMEESRFDIADAGTPAIRVVGIDSVSLVKPGDAGHIVITASHGGLLGNRPETAIKFDVRAAVFNDAGGGIDNAGFTRLPALDARGIAGACVSCFSARIGDARSAWHDGFISALNRTAIGRGGLIGQSCREFVTAMAASGA